MIKDWGEIDHLILFGFGTVGRSCLRIIQRDFLVDYIIDNDEKKQGVLNDELRILSFKEGLSQRKQQKILVMTGGRTYQSVSDVLTRAGLHEYDDYCSIEDFIEEWYWNNKNENCILELHMALTMKCTLACKNCNMFVPYYSEEVTYSINQIKEEIDLLFSYVDTVFCFTFLGGEPLLYKDIMEAVLYLNEHYSRRISSIKIVTNGTVIPQEDFLVSIEKAPVWFSISDYTSNVPYQEQLSKLEMVLAKHGIDYVVSHTKRWCDFGFPSNPPFFPDEMCRAHMDACAPIFHGYNDGKVYYCHVAWSAEKSGKYRLKKGDYIDLRETLNMEDRHKLSEYCNGKMERGYVSFCQVCGGCGFDNSVIVDAGIQI